MQGRTLYWLWLLCSTNCSLYPAGASVSSSVKWQQQHLPEERMGTESACQWSAGQEASHLCRKEGHETLSVCSPRT